MAAHLGVDKIAFTGSTAVGRQIIVEAATGNLKKVSLELGGKSPVVIFPGRRSSMRPSRRRPWPATSPPASSAWRARACSSTPRCMTGWRRASPPTPRTLKDRRRHDAADTFLGPAISGSAEGSASWITSRSPSAEGATPYAAEERARSTAPATSSARPLFTERANPACGSSRRKVFGPVLSRDPFYRRRGRGDRRRKRHQLRPLRLGLDARTSSAPLRVAKRIDSGQVGVNIHAAISPETPFGGNQTVRLGPRIRSSDGLDSYLKTKAISINLGARR